MYCEKTSLLSLCQNVNLPDSEFSLIAVSMFPLGSMENGNLMWSAEGLIRIHLCAS